MASGILGSPGGSGGGRDGAGDGGDAGRGAAGRHPPSLALPQPLRTPGSYGSGATPREYGDDGHTPRSAAGGAGGSFGSFGVPGLSGSGSGSAGGGGGGAASAVHGGGGVAFDADGRDHSEPPPHDILSILDHLPQRFTSERHSAHAMVPFRHLALPAPPPPTWRARERLKTVAVGLVMCLNVGTDPPDVFKVHPCARDECWIDPFSLPPQKALEKIGLTLQDQYTRWQPRARYRVSMDPTVEDVRKLSVTLRKIAKDERVLLHYNGHGVPRPTPSGELWLFNTTYTQYMPLSVYDLQQWVGRPALFVLDCSSAATLVPHFAQILE
eukprot:CAMPEP_0203813798 /NCGR_PEP_ID=MMETSP0115-20131106/4925_1 /ASSEMBLY_ACC=CAM_ASM_000227 /TAXON_ID=33651 /ORGANISM="Bicosoecid sp, Strain ms1" /LENGTH=325 /DNA_ID=CAMNT_0050722677 /DNA_START=157 /DNA_END=1131 /DNA_ORIENTATION=-